MKPGTKVLALGLIAHNAILAALEMKLSAAKFAHGAMHPLPHGLTLFDSYHCSRYNTNTRRLTKESFHAVFEKIAPRVSG
jgi:uracil-DNA glycosylase